MIIFLIINLYLFQGIENIQNSMNYLRERFDMALMEATQTGTERHEEIMERINRIQFLETRLEEIKNQPAPSTFFAEDWPEILKGITGRDPRTVDFKDRHGDCMLKNHPKFNILNTNLFGLAVIDRMYSKEQQATMCGPYTVRGNNLPQMPQDDVFKLQGKLIYLTFKLVFFKNFKIR